MEKEEIVDLFSKEINCAQIVVSRYAERLGASEAVSRKMASCFGGGMSWGKTCGAVTGALMALGLKYGNGEANESEQVVNAREKSNEFRRRFLEKYPSIECADLLGHDISLPGEMEKVLEDGTMFSYCPCIVRDVIEILDEMI